MPTDKKLKPLKEMTVGKFVNKEVKLSYHERRMPENKLRWRNHFKFVGVLPDFRGFEKVEIKQVMPIKHFREKRTFINIFEWLKPDELLLILTRVCKKFYILSWSDELINKITFNQFGDRGLREIKYRCAQRLMQVKTGTVPMEHGKEKERWMIETSTSEESSQHFTS